MKKIISKIIITIVPKRILDVIFPGKFYYISPYNKFISIEDPIAQKPFEMFLRNDGVIEKEFMENGLYGGWEKESLKIWAELAKHTNTVIDIGANTGTYALLAQNNNANSKVIAIEPIDINFAVLSQNIKKNKFPILAEKVALSEKEGTAKMFMLKDKLNYMTSVNDDRYALHPEIKLNTEVVEIEVPLKPFSFIYEKYKLSGIDLIKIDVEGHELTVLNAMFTYLEKYKPTILIEVIGDEHAIDLDKLFRKAGYEKYISINEKDKSVVVDKLWDNDHRNFLVCNSETVENLKNKGLVQ